jgi:putative effector of murein hydrolase LrgA (UPF0299 family)
MIRTVLTEIGIFLVPFAVYAIWPLHMIAKLTLVALVMVIVSFVALAELTGAPPNSTYVPAHIENGRLVPGVER